MLLNGLRGLLNSKKNEEITFLQHRISTLSAEYETQIANFKRKSELDSMQLSSLVALTQEKAAKIAEIEDELNKLKHATKPYARPIELPFEKVMPKLHRINTIDFNQFKFVNSYIAELDNEQGGFINALEALSFNNEFKPCLNIKLQLRLQWHFGDVFIYRRNSEYFTKILGYSSFYILTHDKLINSNQRKALPIANAFDRNLANLYPTHLTFQSPESLLYLQFPIGDYDSNQLRGYQYALLPCCPRTYQNCRQIILLGLANKILSCLNDYNCPRIAGQSKYLFLWHTKPSYRKDNGVEVNTLFSPLYGKKYYEVRVSSESCCVLDISEENFKPDTDLNGCMLSYFPSALEYSKFQNGEMVSSSIMFRKLFGLDADDNFKIVASPICGSLQW